MSTSLLLAALSLLICLAQITHADLNSGVEDADLTLDSITGATRRGYNEQASARKSSNQQSAEETDRLSIGIKKRPDSCDRQAQKGDTLHMHYKGLLAIGGQVFDSSYDRGQPFVFTLGAGQVIKGWDQGLMGICAGEKRKLVIPPQLAYGESGSPPTIPPRSTLVFEVEAVKVIAGTKRQDL